MPDGKSPAQLHVFLCHSSGDKEDVRALYQRLKAEAWLHPWLDEEELLPGQNWRDEIEKAVEQSQIILVCLTPASISKEGYVQREIRVALDHADYMPEGTAYIVPVKLAECDIPRRLRQWQGVNYYKEGSHERLLKALRLRAEQVGISTDIPPPPTAPTVPATPPSSPDLVAPAPSSPRPASRSALIRLLRERLSVSDVRDIADEYGERQGVQGSLYAQIIGQVGVNDAVRELVQYTANRTDTAALVEIVVAWRSDMAEGLRDIGYSTAETTPEHANPPSPAQTFAPLTKPVPLSPLPAPQSVETEQDRLLREITDMRTDHMRRRDIGDKLAKIGDTRKGVGLRADGLPDILWQAVTPGGNMTIEKQKYQIAPFLIATYPITYAQFEAFVKAKDGYNNREWWQNFPEEYQPQGLDNPTNGLGNSPRDTVSWYQAVAFTRWLHKQLVGQTVTSEKGDLSLTIGRGAEVRLPTEWQWQWAAQGGTAAREYPWGAWREGYANTREARLNRTIAVGLYPQGAAACGAMDMSGNVWQWCENKYSKDNEYRVLRGGSFDNNSRSAACAFRVNLNPHVDNNNIGFRVVVAGPSVPSDL